MLHLIIIKNWLQARVAEIDWGDERGEVTEKVLIVGIFAGLAIAAGAIIVGKVLAKANGLAIE